MDRHESYDIVVLKESECLERYMGTTQWLTLTLSYHSVNLHAKTRQVNDSAGLQTKLDHARRLLANQIETVAEAVQAMMTEDVCKRAFRIRKRTSKLFGCSFPVRCIWWTRL